MSRSNIIGLSNVDDTSDAAKPVSTAQQTALDLKADSISPTLVTPALGTPSSGVATNLTGIAAGLTVGATTGVEAGADVTDAANVAAAGAVMNTGSETVAGDKTLSGQLELTGQTSATADSAMTRELVRTDTMFRDVTRMGTNHWATTFTGSGGINQYESTFRISTGTTTGSSALARGNAGSLFLISANGATSSTIDWNQRLRCRFDFGFTQNDANTVLRFQVGETYSKTTVTDLDKKGMGIKIINNSLYALTHDGTTLTTSAPLATPGASTKNQIVMDSDGAGNVTFYLNGAVLAVQTGGPTTSGAANDTAVNFSSQNGAGTKFHQCILSGDIIFQYGD
jgi:hypothetical protein